MDISRDDPADRIAAGINLDLSLGKLKPGTLQGFEPVSAVKQDAILVYGYWGFQPVRFDVIGIQGEAGAARLTHVKGAFEVPHDF